MGFLIQFHGLAGALFELHSSEMRHGDLRPHKILSFGRTTPVGALKIVNHGTARFHNFRTDISTADIATRSMTQYYAAPELITTQPQPRSRKGDLWSMGCVILDSMIWLLYGSDALHTFWREDYTERSTDTRYLTLSESQETAEISKIVTTWMELILKEDPECNKPTGTALGDLLNLVQNELLVVDVASRANARTLRQKLDFILAKAEGDAHYLFTGGDRTGISLPKILTERMTDSISPVRLIAPQNLVS